MLWCCIVTRENRCTADAPVQPDSYAGTLWRDFSKQPVKERSHGVDGRNKHQIYDNIWGHLWLITHILSTCKDLQIFLFMVKSAYEDGRGRFRTMELFHVKPSEMCSLRLSLVKSFWNWYHPDQRFISCIRCFIVVLSRATLQPRRLQEVSL